MSRDRLNDVHGSSNNSESKDTVSTSKTAYGTSQLLLIECSYKKNMHDDDSYNYVMCFSADLAVMLGIGWLFEVCCQNASECR